MSHVWFQQLDRAVGLSNLVLATCAKVLLDLAFFTPVWCVAFLGAMALMQGQGPREAGRRIRTEGLELYTGNLLAWLPANFVIYSVVPLELRVPAFGIYNLVYTIFLSFWAERRHCRAEEVERGLLDGASSLVADLLQSYPARWARHRLGCGACGGRGMVPCARGCGGLGHREAVGGQRVVCRSCRGTGNEVCRQCFVGNPWDIAEARAKLERAAAGARAELEPFGVERPRSEDR